MIGKFNLEVPDKAIFDLKHRLSLGRFPDTPPAMDWHYGTDVNFMVRLVNYWQNDFDWKHWEARLNALPQYKIKIDGTDIHFLHIQGEGTNPKPLLMLHGWPGSIFEFLGIIPRLTHPSHYGGSADESLTLIIPSLPGYGLSFSPGQKRYTVPEIANACTTLMNRLGYEQFGLQGGDWGAYISTLIAQNYPEKALGLHLNMLPIRPDKTMRETPTDAEIEYMKSARQFQKYENAYMLIQGTRPQTLAHALIDSPIGLASWIIEKFYHWSDCDGDLESYLGFDILLANISFYWFTGSIGSSFHPYYGFHQSGSPIKPGKCIKVPVGFAEFPKEILHPPRSLAERYFPNLRSWTKMEKGGHFAALEQPALLARDVLDFFKSL